MNPLQTLIRLKKTSIRRIAREEGVGYHALQKTIKGIRIGKRMRVVIAGYLGVTPEALFGPGSDVCIRYLMEQEINQQAEKQRKELRKKYLVEP